MYYTDMQVILIKIKIVIVCIILLDVNHLSIFNSNVIYSRKEPLSARKRQHTNNSNKDYYYCYQLLLLLLLLLLL